MSLLSDRQRSSLPGGGPVAASVGQQLLRLPIGSDYVDNQSQHISISHSICTPVFTGSDTRSRRWPRGRIGRSTAAAHALGQAINLNIYICISLKSAHPFCQAINLNMYVCISLLSLQAAILAPGGDPVAASVGQQLLRTPLVAHFSQQELLLLDAFAARLEAWGWRVGRPARSGGGETTLLAVPVVQVRI